MDDDIRLRIRRVLVTPEMAREWLEKTRDHPYNPPPLLPGVRERGKVVWAEYMVTLSNRARRVLSDLPPDEFELVKGALLAEISCKDGFCPVRGDAPVLKRVLGSHPEFHRKARKFYGKFFE